MELEIFTGPNQIYLYKKAGITERALIHKCKHLLHLLSHASSNYLNTWAYACRDCAFSDYNRVVKSQMSQLKFPPPVWVKTLIMMGDSVSDGLVRMRGGEGSDWAAGLGEVEGGELQGGELPC